MLRCWIVGVPLLVRRETSACREPLRLDERLYPRRLQGPVPGPHLRPELKGYLSPEDAQPAFGVGSPLVWLDERPMH